MSQIVLLTEEGAWSSVKVEAAAIKDHKGKLWTLPKPSRHPDIMRCMSEKGLSMFVRESDKGFLLTNGEFVSRRTAKVIAGFQGQLLKPSCNVPELYTEDMW